MKGEKQIRWVFENGCIRCVSHFHDRENYPFLRRGGKRMKMARHILFRKYGEQPVDIISRHTCDSAWCINPDHIIPGTHADNYRDKIERGRVPHGEGHWNSRLTNEQVLEIRGLIGTITNKEIAVRFGIGHTHVSNIKSGHRRAKESLNTFQE